MRVLIVLPAKIVVLAEIMKVEHVVQGLALCKCYLRMRRRRRRRGRGKEEGEKEEENKEGEEKKEWRYISIFLVY